MNKNNKNALTAVTYGLDERSCEALRIAFAGPGKGCSEIITDETAADFAIINMDNIKGAELWKNMRDKYPQRHAIVLAMKDPELEDAFFVSRPVRIDKMINTVKKIKDADPIIATPAVTPRQIEPSVSTTKIQTEMESLPDIETPQAPMPGQISEEDLNDPAFQEKFYYDPEGYLQSALTKAIDLAKKKNSAVQVSINLREEWKRVITILPESKKILVSVNDTWLENACTMPIYMLSLKVQHYTSNDTEKLEADAKNKNAGLSYDVFLWKIAIWTSQGRAPKGVDLNKPVYLRHWPNITRLVTIPHTMRIVTLLIDKPQTLPLISRVLRVPHTHVFSIFSAAYAIGIADTASRDADTLIQPDPPKKHKHRGLFGKIMSKLRSR